jgi:hypothetical protein
MIFGSHWLHARYKNIEPVDKFLAASLRAVIAVLADGVRLFSD